MFLKRGIVPVALVLLLLLGGCAQLQSVVATEPTASPTATLPAAIAQPVTSRNGSAVASGEVLPAQKAQLGFSTAGRVDSVSVAVGDSVAAGDVLIVLDQAAAEASVAMARAGLLRAQANAKDLREGSRPQEIAAAQARLDAANARLTQLTEGASSEDVTAAQANLAAAQASLQQLYSGPREADRIAAESALANAESARQAAQSAYDRVSWRSDVAMLPESAALQQATNDYIAAQARYDALF
ncbi:MAG: biotin/lipoyl-binding protein, partial [Caldilineaceae bacterium]|nr:biotin/lipoyl-binding protein [Caldilineaceae bacterium]